MYSIKHLDKQPQRLLALWAADCAEHVLSIFEEKHPQDYRPRKAIEAARAWVRGELRCGAARAAAVAAHAAARDSMDIAARAVARAAGHAAGTAHMAGHARHAAAYAVKAAAATSPTGTETGSAMEHDWQRKRLPEQLSGQPPLAQYNHKMKSKHGPKPGYASTAIILLAFLVCIFSSIATEPQRPNIVFILADDATRVKLHRLTKDRAESKDVSKDHPDIVARFTKLALDWKATLLLFPLAAVPAEDFAARRDQVLALAKLTPPPAMHAAEGFASEGGMKAIFFEALPWKGKPTRVFAWLGMPEKRSGKVPGIVLVHGGGGTAFKEWVKKWNEHGFAAISIAVEGQTDELNPATPKGQRAWKQHAWPGPKREGIYADSSEPLTEQWMYHAVADTILANSLLHSLAEVDGNKIGLTGISWGGVITSTVIGIDDRFAFAIPTYGCGHLFDADNQYGRALGNNPWYREVWDPMVRIARVKMPVLWFSWPEDGHFPLDCQAACYRATPGPHMVSLIPGMKHSHPAGWNPPDSYAFAENIVSEGKPWCVQTGSQIKAGSVFVTFAATKPLDHAMLISTTDTGFTGNRKWTELPAKLENQGNAWLVTVPLPAATTSWFVNVRSGGLTVSSDYQAVK
jgi:dienelactone hydrolase